MPTLLRTPALLVALLLGSAPALAGAPRTFSKAEVEVLRADWQQVLSQKLPLRAFMQTHRLHSKMMKRLRDEHPGAFPPARNLDKRKSLGDADLEQLKTDYLEVVAGRQTVQAFCAKHDLSKPYLQRRLSRDERTAPDFPLVRASEPASGRKLAAGVVADWNRLLDGSLSSRSFRQRHPDVRAVQLLAIERSTLAPTQLRALEGAWSRVERGEISQKGLLDELGLKVRDVVHYRREHEGAFPLPGKKYADGATPFSDVQVKSARELFARYHRGELAWETGLLPALRDHGISQKGIGYLRKLDPVAFGTQKEFEERHRDAIIDELVRVVEKHRSVIFRWSDFVEVAAKDEGLRARYGALNLDNKSSLMHYDRAGKKRLQAALKACGVSVARVKGEAAVDEKPARPAAATPAERARALAEGLRGLEPTPETFWKVAGKLAQTYPSFASRTAVLKERDRAEGVLPELRRWNFNEHRPYSLRYLARWTLAAHEAGPGASYEEIVRLFKRSAEYREDGRVPPKRQGTVIIAEGHPELVSSWRVRQSYQRTRQLLELLRTAPSGATLYSLEGELKRIGLSGHSAAHLLLKGMSPDEAASHGMDRATFGRLRAGGFRGLGGDRDPRFDPNAEPAGIDLQLARDIVDTPRVPPMLEFAALRLNGELPFEHHNVMFINHRYSDIVPFVETFARAGMARKNALFVSTPYPFKDSVSYQLKDLGVETITSRLSMKSYKASVEKGIRRMLALYEQQVKDRGQGRPILIIDDGGMAAKIIDEKFKEHLGKFRLVEVTAAGHRQAKAFAEKNSRLGFVYYSIAYTDAKKAVTSGFFGKRVVDRVLDLVPQSKIELKNKQATILGGGPMGLAAARRLRSKGYAVTFVEPDPGVAARLRRAGFKRIAPIEEALPGRSIILGMSGYESLKAEHVDLIDDGAVVAQGSSKRQEFQMDRIAALARSRELLPREDGLAQRSYTYGFKLGGKTKRLHFLGDGWTINHDGSLHGTPIEDIQLELALLFESAVQATRTNLYDTGSFRELDGRTQKLYVDEWKRLKRPR